MLIWRQTINFAPIQQNIINGSNFIVFLRCIVTFLSLLRPRSGAPLHADVLHLDEGEPRQQDRYADEAVQKQRRSPRGRHPLAQHHRPHHRFGWRGSGVHQDLRRAIFRADIGHPHSLDPRALGDHPQDHRRLLLAIPGHAFHQDHPRAHPHHLSPGAALGTDHQGLHPRATRPP